jgi:hypothetical protein
MLDGRTVAYIRDRHNDNGITVTRQLDSIERILSLSFVQASRTECCSLRTSSPSLAEEQQFIYRICKRSSSNFAPQGCIKATRPIYSSRTIPDTAILSISDSWRTSLATTVIISPRRLSLPRPRRAWIVVDHGSDSGQISSSSIIATRKGMVTIRVPCTHWDDSSIAGDTIRLCPPSERCSMSRSDGNWSERWAREPTE